MDATLIRFRQIWVSITRTKTNSETCFSRTRVHDTEPPLTGKLHLLSEHVPEQCIIGNNAGATTTAATTTTAVTAATTTTTTSTKTDKSFKWVSFILSFKNRLSQPFFFTLSFRYSKYVFDNISNDLIRTRVLSCLNRMRTIQFSSLFHALYLMC